MFNETSIYGHTTVKKDPKGRIFLPSFTNVEKDDELVLMRYKTFYKIMSKEAIDTLLCDLEIDIEEAHTRRGASIEELTEYRDFILFSILRILNPGTQGRVILSDIYEDEDTLRIVGAGDGVYILNETEYQKLKELKKEVAF